MKKYLSMMAFAAMTVCALVACGGGDDDDEPKGPETPDAPEVPETPKTLEPKTFTVEKNGRKVSFTMMPVEAGTFTMGATSEQKDHPFYDETPHSVTLTKDYYIGETEVTQELWLAVLGTQPSYNKGISLPVEQVSWGDCMEFLLKLNQMTGQNFRLPTEAEWEYAARGGKKGKGYQYSGNYAVGEVAWFWNNSSEKTHPVKSKKPNELGIYDMSGNVWEWCQDWYGDYPDKPLTNPKGPTTGLVRVVRGGCFKSDSPFCRTAFRYSNDPTYTSGELGFRLAL